MSESENAARGICIKTLAAILLIFVSAAAFAEKISVKCNVGDVISIPAKPTLATAYLYTPLFLTVSEPQKINGGYSDCLIFGYARADFEEIVFEKKLLVCGKGGIKQELTGSETFEGTLMLNGSRERLEALSAQLANHTLCGRRDCADMPTTSDGLGIAAGAEENGNEFEALQFDLRLLSPVTILSPYETLTVTVGEQIP